MVINSEDTVADTTYIGIFTDKNKQYLTDIVKTVISPSDLIRNFPEIKIYGCSDPYWDNSCISNFSGIIVILPVCYVGTNKIIRILNDSLKNVSIEIINTFKYKNKDSFIVRYNEDVEYNSFIIQINLKNGYMKKAFSLFFHHLLRQFSLAEEFTYFRTRDEVVSRIDSLVSIDDFYTFQNDLLFEQHLQGTTYRGISYILMDMSCIKNIDLLGTVEYPLYDYADFFLNIRKQTDILAFLSGLPTKPNDKKLVRLPNLTVFSTSDDVNKQDSFYYRIKIKFTEIMSININTKTFSIRPANPYCNIYQDIPRNLCTIYLEDYVNFLQASYGLILEGNKINV